MIRVAFVAGSCAVVLGVLIIARTAYAQYDTSQNQTPQSLEQEIKRVEAEIDKIFAGTLAQLPAIPGDAARRMKRVQTLGKLELFASRMIPPLSYDSRLQAALIDVDRGPDRDHRVQALDVLVAHAHAAMAHGLPDGFGVISTVDSIAVAQLETARSHHAHVPARGCPVRRNDDVPIHDDLLSFDAPT